MVGRYFGQSTLLMRRDPLHTLKRDVFKMDCVGILSNCFCGVCFLWCIRSLYYTKLIIKLLEREKTNMSVISSVV